ncbi:MAG: aminotransferase class V-fold PLP-dependent enzyme [Termitinemataceae bacterium]|nr:MAG: aminotransferase class V-fold PLP-dependent enzyme [Termitinemataceae bacterium]
MEERHVYLDYNATTPLRPEVRQEIVADLEIYGNASSMHESGRLARARIEEARRSVAALIGAKADNITFSSGGSESNNMVFQTFRRIACDDHGVLQKNGRSGIITTAIEHPCVMNSASYLKSLGFDVTFLPVDEYGRVKMDAYKDALNEKTLLVSIMLANNEIGTIQDIKEIARLAKDAGAYIHTDGVQAAGKIPVNVDDLGVDYLTVSCHKIYGPKGVGALYRRSKAPLFPLVHGGHQEDGLRAGTYNNTGILGFGKASDLALTGLSDYAKHTSTLRDRLQKGLLANVPNIKINGHPDFMLPNTLNISFPGAEGESILLGLDLKGIQVSTGSACASGSLDPSHVLMAIGVWPELAHGSIRFSLGLGTTQDEIDYVIETVPPIIKRLRAMSTLGCLNIG